MPELEGQVPETYFAPAQRSGDAVIRQASERVMESPLMSALLLIFSNLVAVLDANRQVLAINDSFISFLGIDDPDKYLGLRPGEVLGCDHAGDHPGGCGTSHFCSTCGAAKAIMEAQESGKPVERECLLMVGAQGGCAEGALELMVRAVPVTIEHDQLILLMLEDVRDRKRREALESTFFHDFNNILTGVIGNAELMDLAGEGRSKELASNVARLARMAADEMHNFQLLARAREGDALMSIRRVELAQLFRKVLQTFEGHPAVDGVQLVADHPEPGLSIESDAVLIHRVLVNMIKNACEATDRGGRVRLFYELTPEGLALKVWNASAMPEEVALRVFQRYFSTKQGGCRGIGTYSMKLFGERYLGGRVEFTSDRMEGTIFTLTLPLEAPTV